MFLKSSSILLSAGAMAVVVGAGIGIPGFAKGDNLSLGINFVAYEAYGPYAAVETVTGTAGYVPQDNWNNIGTDSGGTYPAVATNAAATLLSDGSAFPSTTVSYTSYTTQAANVTPNGGDTAEQIQNVYLMNSVIQSGLYYTTPGDTTVTVNNVPAGIAGAGTTPYNVILYIAANANSPGSPNGLNYTVNGVTQSNIQDYNYVNPDGDFTLATNSSTGNYLIFIGITGTTLSIDISGEFTPINGLQVVAAPVPEPTALGLLAIAGGLALMAAKRRRPWQM